MINEPKNLWESFYGPAIPIAHILRHQVAERWLRIHSLPGSKRYPETPEEYTTLLTRHNVVATEVLGAQAECMLLVGRYASPTEGNTEPEDLPEISGKRYLLFESIEGNGLLMEPEDNLSPICIWMTSVVWEPGAFDEIIRAVADDVQYNIMFFSCRTGEAYAPYDGGADLFLSSVERRKTLRDKFEMWLSKHPQGL